MEIVVSKSFALIDVRLKDCALVKKMFPFQDPQLSSRFFMYAIQQNALPKGIAAVSQQHYERLKGDCVAKNGSAYFFCSGPHVSYPFTVLIFTPPSVDINIKSVCKNVFNFPLCATATAFFYGHTFFNKLFVVRHLFFKRG